jgi:hypothetical protein
VQCLFGGEKKVKLKKLSFHHFFIKLFAIPIIALAIMFVIFIINTILFNMTRFTTPIAQFIFFVFHLRTTPYCMSKLLTVPANWDKNDHD